MPTHLLVPLALVLLLAALAAGWLSRPRQPVRHLARRFGPEHRHPRDRRLPRDRRARH